MFYDEHALQVEDPDEAGEEQHLVMLGLSSVLRVLAVCHCVRASGNEIRIISARKAVRAEQKQDWERLKR